MRARARTRGEPRRAVGHLCATPARVGGSSAERSVERNQSRRPDPGLRCLRESRIDDRVARHPTMPLTILVVEDHTEFRRLTCTALQRRGKVESSRPRMDWRRFRRGRTAAGFDSARHQPAEDSRIRSRETGPQVCPRRAASVHEPGILAGHRAKGAQSGRRYIQKVSAATDLLPAIDAVLAGQRFVSRGVLLAKPADALVPRRHEMLFCADDDAMVDGFARYVAGALHVGNAAIVLVTESHRTRLLQELRMQGVDIDGAIARGTCVSFDADVAPDPARWLEVIDDVRAAAAKAGNAQARVAFCGERAGRLCAAGRTAEAISSKNSATNCRMASTFCARIRGRTGMTIPRSCTSARCTPRSPSASDLTARN